jgi:hypothetical protein
VRRVLLAALVALVLAPAARSTAEPGPYATAQRDYDLGRETLQIAAGDWRLHALPTRLGGEITVPVGAPGRRPVVVFLHGAHQSCEVIGGFFPTQDWPCRPGFVDVPSFRGYRYAAQLLASHGFVVVSFDGNPVAPANSGMITFPDGEPFTPRSFMDLRAKLVDAQLRRLARAGRGETGPAVDFRVALAGRLDLDRVGLIGHSRGGEGVVWASLLPGPRPYRVEAILALAPVDFFRRLVPDVPFGVVLPACDGDVFDLQGAQFYDDARAEPRTEPLWQVVVFGANHNFFNRVWQDETGFLPIDPESGEVPEDPCSPATIGTTRLSRADQEAVGAEVAVRFMQGFLAGRRDELVPLGLDGDLPRRIAGASVGISVQPARVDRLDVIRVGERPDLHRNLLGGAQFGVGLDSYRLCTIDPGTITGRPSTYRCGRFAPAQAHAISELRIAWTKRGAGLVTRLPSGKGDVSGFEALTVRVAVDPTDGERNPPGKARPFSIVVRDAEGRTASYRVPSSHPAVRYPVRALVVLSAVRVPLSSFAGVDLTRLAAVELRFDQARRGRLLVTDLSFVR